MSWWKSFAVTVATALVTLFLAIAVQPAKAASINWSTAQNITGASDVVTTGTLFSAVNFFQSGAAVSGSGNVTVNGVTFTGFGLSNANGPTSVTAGNITVTGTSNQAGSLNLLGFGGAGGPASYNGLLNQTLYIYNTGTTSATGKTLNFSINGLTTGSQYLIQYWVQDGRNVDTVRNRTVVVGGQTLAVNVGAVTTGSGLGQYLTGTFTADSSSQTFTAVGGTGDVAYANAMQVRLLAVPEPSTWAIAGVGLACAVIGREVRRRRRNQQRFSAAD